MSIIPKLVRMLSPEMRKALDEQLARGATYRGLVKWLSARGVSVLPEDVRRYAISTGKRQLRSNHHLHLDKILAPEHRSEYEALLADRRTTIAVARAWLAERGYSASVVTIGKHRTRFLQTLEGIRESARAAQALAQVAKECGEGAMTDGMLTRYEQLTFEQLMRLRETEQIDPKQLAELGKSVKGAIASRETMQAISREFEETKRRVAEAAEAAAKSGASPSDVVDRVRKILGV